MRFLVLPTLKMVLKHRFLPRVVHAEAVFVCTRCNSCVYTAICCLVCFRRRLHQKHGGEAGEEGNGAVDELCPEETLLAFGKEWDGSMTVLGDAAGK